MSIEPYRVFIGLIISIIALVLWPRFIKLNAFFSLLSAAFIFIIIAGIPWATGVSAMQSGFGNLLGQIGMVIVLGAVLGTVLEKTGAMESISAGLLNLFGVRHSVLALSVIGALTGIPVFCDSGFIILSRLIPSLATKGAVAEGSLTLALSSSLYTTHSLVPPTPGPLAAGAAMGLQDQMGLVILIGLLVSIPVVLVSFLYSKKFGPHIQTVFTASPAPPPKSSISFLRAVLPLILPIILIAGASFSKIESESIFFNLLSILGIPLIALSLGIILAATLIKTNQREEWTSWITSTLKDAGLILLIIGAGGAFGAVIKSSGLDQFIASFASSERLTGSLFLLLAWSIGALFKIAQGSTTSSMVITSSIFSPLLSAAGMNSSAELCLMVMAIGGGAMTVSHANDAYFWVVSQFGGLTTKDAFRWYTPLTLLQGLTTLIISLTIYQLL